MDNWNKLLKMYNNRDGLDEKSKKTLEKLDESGLGAFITFVEDLVEGGLEQFVENKDIGDYKNVINFLKSLKTAGAIKIANKMEKVDPNPDSISKKKLDEMDKWGERQDIVEIWENFEDYFYVNDAEDKIAAEILSMFKEKAFKISGWEDFEEFYLNENRQGEAKPIIQKMETYGLSDLIKFVLNMLDGGIQQHIKEGKDSYKKVVQFLKMLKKGTASKLAKEMENLEPSPMKVSKDYDKKSIPKSWSDFAEMFKDHDIADKLAKEMFNFIQEEMNKAA